jgi:hypothetical protein
MELTLYKQFLTHTNSLTCGIIGHYNHRLSALNCMSLYLTSPPSALCYFQFAAFQFASDTLPNSTLKVLELKGNFGDSYAVYSHQFLLHPLGEKACVFPTDKNTSQPQRPTSSPADLVDLRGVETTALFWLRECLQNHTSCHSSNLQARPRRLLKIEPDKVYLVETSTLPCMPQYVSLSHSWGRAPTFEVLTSENLHSMVVEVPRDKLAASFRDAVTVCRLLKIEYLWIDSLCIIQKGDGSIEDWGYHVTAMGGIYAGAVVNICADRAASSRDGFLQPREALRYPATVIIPGASNEAFQLVDLEAATLDITTSRTSRRAWILQERLLSPRVLHFTATELYWECSEQRLACESLPNGIPEANLQFRQGLAPFNLGDSFLPPSRDNLQGRRKTVLSGWYRTLDDYASRNISFPDKDKFAALAGVAQEFQRMLEDRYVAGMFVSDLPLALLWKLPESSRPQTPSDLEHQYRAPSWSWASIDGRVEFLGPYLRGDTLKQPADIISATSTLVNETIPLGQITNAELILRGYTVAVQWVYDESERYMDVESCDDQPDFKDIPSVLRQLDNPIKDGVSPAGAIAVLIAALVDNDGHWGLLLVPAAETKYRRIGIWWTCDRQHEMGYVMQTREKVPITLL